MGVVVDDSGKGGPQIAIGACLGCPPPTTATYSARPTPTAPGQLLVAPARDRLRCARTCELEHQFADLSRAPNAGRPFNTESCAQVTSDAIVGDTWSDSW